MFIISYCVLNPSGCKAMTSLICESSKARQISWSSYSENGSRFSLRTITNFKLEYVILGWTPRTYHATWIRLWIASQRLDSNKRFTIVLFAYLIVPLNIIASCGMADNRDRNIRRGTCRMSIPSNRMRPWLISINWKRAITVDDFPLPVLPQMPNCQY